MKPGPHQNPILKIIRGSAATVADTLRPEQNRWLLPSHHPVHQWRPGRRSGLSWKSSPRLSGPSRLAKPSALIELSPAWLFRLWPARSTVEEQATRSMHSALRLCSLPFPWLDSRALTDTIADVLAKALFGRRATILVADVFQIDSESMGVIRPLLRRLVDSDSVYVVLGSIPQTGLRARFDLLRSELVDLELGRLELLTVSVVIEAAGSGRVPATACEVSKPNNEAVACNSTTPLAAAQRRSGQHAAGVRILRLPIRPRVGGMFTRAGLNASDSAELHALAGMAAYNLRNLPIQGKELSKQALAHFRHALALAEGKMRYPHLLCFLCIGECLANRPGPALELADQAISIASLSGSSSIRYVHLAIWGHNARAFVFYRSGDVNRAAADVQTAIDMLQQIETRPDVQRLDVALTRWFLFSNMTRLLYDNGQKEDASRWLPLVEQSVHELRTSWSLPVYNEFSILFAAHGLESQARRYEIERDSARKELDPDAEALQCHALGQIEYRRGFADRAYPAFQRALEIWKRIAPHGEDVLTTTTNCAFAALHAEPFAFCRYAHSGASGGPANVIPGIAIGAPGNACIGGRAPEGSRHGRAL